MPNDQPQVKPGESTTEKPKGLEDQLNLGWEKMLEEMNLGTPTPPPEPTKEPVKLGPDEEPCAECPGGKKTKEKKPYKVLKVDGKEVPVYTEEEYHNLAQKGFDYTRKTQGVSEERKRLQAEYDDKAARLLDLGQKFDQYLAQMKEKPTAKPQLEPGDGQPDVYEEFGLDKELAEPSVVKMASLIVTLQNQLKTLAKKNEDLEQKQNAVTIKESLTEIERATAKEREKFPIEDEIGEDGQSVTKRQFVTLMVTKIQNPDNKKREISDLAAETIRELHYIQRGKKETAPSPDEINKMSPEDFAKKYPDFYKKLTAKRADEAVVEHIEKTESLPPSIERRGGEVEAGKKTSGGSPKSLAEAIEEGFKDAQIKEAFTRT